MAVLSFEVVICLCGLFLLRKFSQHKSFGVARLAGLSFWLPPREEEIDHLVPKISKKQSAGTREAQILRHLETLPSRVQAILNANQHKLVPRLIKGLPFFDQFDLLSFVLAFALFVFPAADFATSVKGDGYAGAIAAGAVALLCVAAFCLATYLSTAGLTSFEGRSAVLSGLALGLVDFLALHFLPGGVLDADIRAGFADLWARTSRLLAAMDMPRAADDVGSPVLFTAALSAVCAFLGALLLLPSLRFARTYHTLVRADAKTPRATVALLHASFFAPLFAGLLWVRPMTAAFVTTPHLTRCAAAAPARDCVVEDALAAAAESPLGIVVTESDWAAVQFVALLVVAGLRLVLARTHVQAFLRAAASPEVIADVASDLLDRPTAAGPKRGRAGDATRSRTAAAARDGGTRESRRKTLVASLTARYRVYFNYAAVAAALHSAPAAVLVALAALLKLTGVSLGAATAARRFLGLPPVPLAPAPDGTAAAISGAVTAVLPGATREALEIASPLLTRATVNAVALFVLTAMFVFSAAGLLFATAQTQSGLHSERLASARRAMQEADEARREKAE